MSEHTPAPTEAAEYPLEETVLPAANGNGVAAAPPAVIDRLRKGFAQKQSADRHKTFLITPGAYDSSLGVRLHRVEWEHHKKRAEKAAQSGTMNTNKEQNFAAQLLVEACDTILLRDDADGKLKPAAEIIDQYKGQGAVGFDDRLAEMVGLDPEGLDEVGICRIVYGNEQALTFAFQQAMAWLSEETPDDEPDEEDDAAPSF